MPNVVMNMLRKGAGDPDGKIVTGDEKDLRHCPWLHRREFADSLRCEALRLHLVDHRRIHSKRSALSLEPGDGGPLGEGSCPSDGKHT